MSSGTSTDFFFFPLLEFLAAPAFKIFKRSKRANNFFFFDELECLPKALRGLVATGGRRSEVQHGSYPLREHPWLGRGSLPSPQALANIQAKIWALLRAKSCKQSRPPWKEDFKSSFSLLCFLGDTF